MVFFVVDERAGGNLYDEVGAVVPGHFFAHAAFTALGFPVMPAGEIQERVLADIGDENDGAAVTAVTTIGAALGDEFFAAKGNATVPAVTGFDVDDGFVDEHGKE